ncbi:DEAD/DEAH box helicase [Marinimicrobium sp. LS-A18]|uniref:DEAD/DEAH box helicase n=1 Tax=Marinimicrobium sp. LS-A18 TaxID=1381596 RepID=UPI000464233A|nr:DEAD/DEAH box helicase [Marinimicrobium sp. LS-A18]
MSHFDQLHPALQHHIVNSLGWPGLRPLQEAAIPPLIRGEHAILLAPTAGGKTEAACFPVFSRMLSERWNGLSVLYICPIKALLNNLESRLEYYGSLLGRRVAVWHGDVSPSRKAKILADPPDILLTTPESLEAILVSSRMDHRRFFGHLKSVVIDEIHAFAGDDRGWHLLAVLERLSVIAGSELQRLGLSATVGNTDELCGWLAGSCQKPRSVINPYADATQETDVQVDWVGSLQNAATVVSRLHRGEKRLVFVDSRSRVEQLAAELRARQVTTFVSHSSLSLEERRAAEAAFAEGNDCVIVATSTLELGIDVGDLDRVIQLDSPSTVSSFLQRIGRTGRRSGSIRNCLFLATTESAFLQTLAVLSLWQRGYVEPVTPPRSPLHIYAQQIMALILQEQGIIAEDIDRWLGKMPGFAELDSREREGLLNSMLETGILHSDCGVLGIGQRGERTFGAKHFMELVSVFTAPPMVKVFYGRQELGEVHEITFAVGEEGPALLTLAGRNWATTYVDWPRRKAYVEPTEIKGRSQWLSAGRPLGYSVAREIAAVLSEEVKLEGLSKRSDQLLSDFRDEFDWLEPGKVVITIQDDNLTLWTFSGALLNAAIANHLQGDAKKVRFDNIAVTASGVYDVSGMTRSLRDMFSSESSQLQVPLDSDFIQELKFSECLPQKYIDNEIARRYDCSSSLSELIRNKLEVVHFAALG